MSAPPLPKVEQHVCPQCGPYWLFAGDSNPTAIHLEQYHSPRSPA